MTLQRAAAFAAALCVLAGCQRGIRLDDLRPPRSAGSPPASGASVRVAAAGDIACEPGSPPAPAACRMEATATLVEKLDPDAVLALGDLQYPSGALRHFQASYDKTWGRFGDRTHPAPGNHEYGTRGAAGYFAYFSPRAGAAGEGWYAADVGAWRVIALNSNCARVGCGAGSPQERWLRGELRAHARDCTLAFWHHPRFSSGPHGNNVVYDAFWRALHEAGAELVLNGHDHDYERFAPMRPTGQRDERGLRQFVVGTGGASRYGFTLIKGNSEARIGDAFGVLELTLSANGYAWRFVDVDGRPRDSGSGTCHEAVR